MGECLIQVPMRLKIATAQRMEADAERFPFCEGRGAIGRELIELAYEVIDAGIIEFQPGTLQEVRRNLRQRSVQSVPRVPEKTWTVEQKKENWTEPQAKKAIGRK